MMKCNEAGAMMEKEEFEKLPFFKRIGLRFHLLICKCCNGYKSDCGQMNSIIQTANSKHANSGLTQEEKSEIKEKLAE